MRNKHIQEPAPPPEDLDLQRERLRNKRLELQNEKLEREIKKGDSENKITNSLRVVSFGTGVILVGLGVLDAAFDPFAFIAAPKLIVTGSALMGIGLTGKKKNISEGDDNDL